MSVTHSCRAIARNTLAYSNLRRLSWPLAYLDLPLLFFVFGAAHTSALDTFASLGKASGHVKRYGQPGTVQPPRRARLLLWPIVVGEFVVLLLPIALVNRLPLLFVTVWFVLFMGLPIATYVTPAFVQFARGGNIKTWEAETTRTYLGRHPVSVNTLDAWPIKGGGRRTSSGHGLELAEALAADARAEARSWSAPHATSSSRRSTSPRPTHSSRRPTRGKSAGLRDRIPVRYAQRMEWGPPRIRLCVPPQHGVHLLAWGSDPVAT